jgi:hypothetical protein
MHSILLHIKIRSILNWGSASVRPRRSWVRVWLLGIMVVSVVAVIAVVVVVVVVKCMRGVGRP